MMVEHAKDFQDLHYALVDSFSALTVAEVHGSLCGILCSPAAESGIEEWFNHVLESVAEEQHEGLRTLLQQLLRSTEEQLDSADFSFTPLLLDNEQADLADRCQALIDWCSSFIFGFGLGHGDPQVLPADGLEFYRDLENICRLTIPEAPDESSERSYEEIVEYIKVGALLLRQMKVGFVLSGQSLH